MVASGWGVSWLERLTKELSQVMEIVYTLREWCQKSSNLLHLKICVFHYVHVILLIKIKMAIALLYFVRLINDLQLAQNLT